MFIESLPILLISTLTPLMGMSLLVVSQVAGIPFGTLAKGILPWLIPPLAVTILLILFPGIATFLPRLL